MTGREHGPSEKVIVFEIAVPAIYTADLETYREYEKDFASESEWLSNLIGEPGVCRLRVETSGEKDSSVTEVWGDIRAVKLVDRLPSETTEELARLASHKLLRDIRSCEWCDYDTNCESSSPDREGAET